MTGIEKLMRAVAPFIGSPSITVDEAFEAGRSAGRDGANQENCHYRFFATPELTRAWERGRSEVN